MTFRSAAALTLLCVLTPGHASITGTKVPVEFEVSPEFLDNLPVEQRSTLEALRHDVGTHLWCWDDFKVELPESAFDQDAVIVHERDLFRTPDDGELRELTTAPNGERVGLSAEHLESIRNSGTIVVPSKRYPGHNHVWKIHTFWQTGREKVNVSFNHAKGLALNQIQVQIPERLKPGGTFPNVYRGADNFLDGLKRSLSTVIGLIEMSPLHTDAEVTEILRLEAADYVLARGAELPLDLRLYDVELMKKVRPALDDLLERFDRDWPLRQDEFLVRYLHEMRERGLTGEILTAGAREHLTYRRLELFYEALRNDQTLESISPGIAKLLINRDEAVRIVTEVQTKFEADVASKRAQETTAFHDAHPVKKHLPGVVAKAVDAEVAFYREQRLRQAHNEILKRLGQAGLHQEPLFVVNKLSFELNQANARRAELAGRTQPSRSASASLRIWNSANWIKRERKDSDGKVKHFADTDRVETVTSAVPLWRMELMGVRFEQALRNQLYYLKESLKIAAKSTFHQNEFFTKERVNPDTGEVEPDPASKMGTWATRQRKIEAAWSAANARFEAAEDGDLPKNLMRPMIRARNASLAALATTGLAGAHSLGFVCVGMFSCTGMLASPITSPAYAFARWLGDALYVDSADFARTSARHPRTAPLLWQAGLSIAGAGESLVAGLAVPAHLAAFGALRTGGRLRKNVTDNADMARSFLFSKLNLPNKNQTPVFERVSGPGLKAETMFIIEPALALTALRAKLESVELKMLLKRAKVVAREPEEQADRHLARYRSAGVNLNGEWLKSVRTATTDLHETLDKQFKQRRLPVLGKPDTAAVRLREADIEPTLTAGTTLTKEFWDARDLQIDWTGKSLTEGDYRGLTERLFAEVFGAQFLRPIPPEDDTLVFEQHTPDYARAFGDLLNDRPIRDEDVSLEAPDRKLAVELAPDVDPRLHRHDLAWSLNQTCEGVLITR